ncbi:Uncharacterized protein Adt_23868 [Abeliophyllum distichum]|uniref:Uncharacterized protein n=1 Tax=Abeliophyllum distichum TaxID=126358 RepID=A0ABD1SC28_9LAMI
MYQYINKTDNTLQHQQASLKNLETQIGRISTALSGSPQGPFPSDTEANSMEHMPSITTRSDEQLSKILDNRHVIQLEETPIKEEDYVEKVKLNGQNEKVIINDVTLMKQFSNSLISSKINFVIKVNEEVEVFIVEFEQGAKPKSNFYEKCKFKFWRINEKWCKVLKMQAKQVLQSTI